MSTDKVTVKTLRSLQPIAALSEQRLVELMELCFVERVSKTLDPFRVKGVGGQLVFLLRGELALTLGDSSSAVVVGGTSEARHPLGRKTPFASAKAITDVELLRIDEDLLDIMVTWDQLAAADKGSGRSAEAGAPYRARLLALPAFLRGPPGGAITSAELEAAFALTGHFLEARVLRPRELPLPDARGRLLAYLKQP